MNNKLIALGIVMLSLTSMTVINAETKEVAKKKGAIIQVSGEPQKKMSREQRKRQERKQNREARAMNETVIDLSSDSDKETVKTIAVPEKRSLRAKKIREERKQKKLERKTFSHKTFDDLQQTKAERLASNDKEAAIKCLEKMVPLCDDLSELKVLMIDLADLLFDTQEYNKASAMYHEFTVLYPGSDEAERALYRAIDSNFKLALDAEHDQTKTLEAKTLAEAFLERSDLFTTHKGEVEVIRKQCEERLLESEINVFRFYLKQGNQKSAQKRLENIKQEFINKDFLDDISLRIAQLEADLSVQQIETHALEQSALVKVAESEKKSFVNRF